MVHGVKATRTTVVISISGYFGKVTVLVTDSHTDCNILVFIGQWWQRKLSPGYGEWSSPECDEQSSRTIDQITRTRNIMMAEAGDDFDFREEQDGLGPENFGEGDRLLGSRVTSYSLDNSKI